MIVTLQIEDRGEWCTLATREGAVSDEGKMRAELGVEMGRWAAARVFPNATMRVEAGWPERAQAPVAPAPVRVNDEPEW